MLTRLSVRKYPLDLADRDGLILASTNPLRRPMFRKVLFMASVDRGNTYSNH